MKQDMFTDRQTDAPRTPMVEGPNLGLMILAIAKANGTDGTTADEMSRTVLQLSKKLKLDAFINRESAGPVPERVQNIMAAFASRGFFEGVAPAHLTSEGELWLNSELQRHILNPTRRDEFWSTIGEATGRRRCPHCQTFNHFSRNACNVCSVCG